MSDVPYAELDKETIAKAYARWAPVYDLVFGAVFERGRHAAIAAAERIVGASSKWELGPAYRFRTIHAQIVCAASISPSPCCARLSNVSPNSD
jgi:hypothetical protein